MAKTREATRGGAASGAPVEECTAAVLEVLDAMFFEVPLEVPEVKNQAPDGAVTARALFSGDLCGSLLVACEAWTARRLAASFLGREDEATVEANQVCLVVCEMANMFCGNALSRIEPHGRFQIATPEIVQPDEGGRDWLTFPLETGAMAVRFQVEEG